MCKVLLYLIGGELHLLRLWRDDIRRRHCCALTLRGRRACATVLRGSTTTLRTVAKPNDVTTSYKSLARYDRSRGTAETKDPKYFHKFSGMFQKFSRHLKMKSDRFSSAKRPKRTL